MYMYGDIASPTSLIRIDMFKDGISVSGLVFEVHVPRITRLLQVVVYARTATLSIHHTFVFEVLFPEMIRYHWALNLYQTESSMYSSDDGWCNFTTHGCTRR